MHFTKREQIAILLLVISIILIIGYNLIIGDTIEVITMSKDDISDQSVVNEEDDKEISKTIMVQITGEVMQPGVVEIPEGSRLMLAVEKLGGLTPLADKERINLSMKLMDEQWIYIPKEGEEIKDSAIVTLPNNNNQGFINGMIDINTASKEILIMLPGIGEVTAEKIIEYRQKTSFTSVEELKNIPGIGSKKYQDIKNMVTVK